jgi:hypothetical protein
MPLADDIGTTIRMSTSLVLRVKGSDIDCRRYSQPLSTGFESLTLLCHVSPVNRLISAPLPSPFKRILVFVPGKFKKHKQNISISSKYHKVPSGSVQSYKREITHLACDRHFGRSATTIFRVIIKSMLNSSNSVNLHGLSPRANYTDRATAACRRSDCQLLRIEGATWSA